MEQGRVVQGLAHQLRLGAVGEAGPGDDRHPRLRQQLGHQIALRAVNHHQLQPELPAEAHGGSDVVGPVGVEVGGQLSRHHRHQRLQLGVVIGHVLVGISVRLGLLVLVLLGFGQVLPDEGRGGHTGHRRLLPVVVDRLGIFPQGKLHGGGGLEHHLVHPAAVGLEGQELPGDGVGRAGAGEHRGHAPLPCLPEAPVQGIHPVDGPELGGTGVGGLVSVVRLKAQGIPEQAQVAVGVDEAGQDMPPLRIQHGALRPGGQGLHGPYGGELLPLKGHEAAGNHRPVHGVNYPVENQH